VFVNLTYNNAAAGAAAEYVHDNKTAPDAALPDAAKTLVANTRAAHADDSGEVRGVDMPKHARTSFIDPAVWHSTPSTGGAASCPTSLTTRSPPSRCART